MDNRREVEAMSEAAKIYVLLTCPDCQSELFNVFDDGAIKCAKCECEICAEMGELPIIH